MKFSFIYGKTSGLPYPTRYHIDVLLLFMYENESPNPIWEITYFAFVFHVGSMLTHQLCLHGPVSGDAHFLGTRSGLEGAVCSGL